MSLEILDFTIDGDGISEIVGSKRYYQNNVNKFLADANWEFCNKERNYTKEDVKEGYVKWYTDKEREAGFICPFLDSGGCYSFCSEYDEGAEEVFIIEVGEEEK